MLDQCRLRRAQQDKTSVLAPLTVDHSAQHREYLRHALNFVEHNRACASVEAAFKLELRILGELHSRVGLFKIDVQSRRKRGARQRRLSHLARTQNQHSWKLAGKNLQTDGMETIPHRPHNRSE